MTSKLKFIIPACLMVVLLSMSFVNVAFADSPIWRETNNLYTYQPTANLVNGQYRITLMAENHNLEGGKKYSLSFKINSDIANNTTVAIFVDDAWQYSGYNSSRPITFNLPADYNRMTIRINSSEYIDPSSVTQIMLNVGDPLPYEPPYSGFRFDFSAIAQTIGQFVQPILTTILPYIFLMIALIIGINAGIRVFRKTAT